MDEIVCDNCQGVGHYANECVSRPMQQRQWSGGWGWQQPRYGQRRLQELEGEPNDEQDGGDYEDGNEAGEYAPGDFDAINFGELAWADSDDTAQWPTIPEGQEAWTTATRKKKRGRGE